MASISSTAAAAALATLILLSAGAARAQPEPKPGPPPFNSALSGVVVSPAKTVERTRYGVVTKQIDMSVNVPYHDLDMKTAEGVAELNNRVNQAAKYVCGELDKMYPEGSPETFFCIKKAVGDAQPQVVLARTK